MSTTQRRYTASFKLAMVEEYMKGPKMPIAHFAASKGISDSTFNDWVVKYKRQGKDFCNVAQDITKIKGIHVVEEEEDEELDSNRIKLKLNGTTIEFDESLLERVLNVIKNW